MMGFANRIGLAALVLGLVAGSASQTSAGFAYSYTSTTTVNSGIAQTLGFDFAVTSPSVYITSLGIFQGTGASPISGQTVYLVDESNSDALLAQATIGTASGSNVFDYSSVSVGPLLVGHTYSIFSLFAASTTQYESASTITFDPNIVNVPIGGSNTGHNTSGTISPPNLALTNVLAVNFQFQMSPPTVPEPSSLALCGIAGIVGAGVAWKRRKRVG